MPEEEVCLNGEFRKLDSGDMSRISAVLSVMRFYQSSHSHYVANSTEHVI